MVRDTTVSRMHELIDLIEFEVITREEALLILDQGLSREQFEAYLKFKETGLGKELS